MQLHDVNLIVLPEMFTTGFTMNPDKAESMQGTTVERCTMAKSQKMQHRK
jgi:predicted amidohydrolase